MERSDEVPPQSEEKDKQSNGQSQVPVSKDAEDYRFKDWALI